MEPTRKTVLFVNFDTPMNERAKLRQGECSRDAGRYIAMLRQALDVEVVLNLAGAEALLSARRFDAVVFRSRSVEHVARRIKHDRPDVRVVVLSAVVPSDVAPSEIVWISKYDIGTPADFARAVLG